MDIDIERVLALLDKLTLVVRGLRFASLFFSIAALLGGLLFWIGLAFAFGPWWLGAVPAVLMSLPALGLWRLRMSLEPTLELPDKVRSLPTSGDAAVEEFSGVADALKDVSESPFTPRAFWKAARGTKSAIDAFQETSVGSVAMSSMALHPAAVLAGGTACLWAAASFAVGFVVFSLTVLI